MLDVADCCETMEEARGVIRRLERAWPKKLTDEQIRECWRECGHNAPMAFAEAIQRKLGVIE